MEKDLHFTTHIIEFTAVSPEMAVIPDDHSQSINQSINVFISLDLMYKIWKAS